nr:uncharacterized protein K02A2.6-like [Rhipicephalus microplus]
MTRYWDHRGDFTVCENMLFMDGRLVVPAALRRDIVNLLHDGHQGVNRCLAVARGSVWWPGLNSQSSWWLSITVLGTLRSSHSGPLLREPVISAIKSTFVRHGIPVTVVSDNGPQFSCKAFEDFGKTYGFTHVTSSPRYPQSNGEAERMVRTIKELLLKATDPFLALLAYRNTPGVYGYSPAQLLMGRSLRNRVPATTQSLVPDWPQVKEFNDRDAAQRRRQQRDYNNRHAAHDLRALDDGEDCLAILSRPPQMRRESPTLWPRQRRRLPDHRGQQPVTHRTLQLLHLLQDRQVHRYTRYDRRVVPPLRLNL